MQGILQELVCQCGLNVFYIVQAHACKCGMDVISVDLTEMTATV